MSSKGSRTSEEHDFICYGLPRAGLPERPSVSSQAVPTPTHTLVPHEQAPAGHVPQKGMTLTRMRRAAQPGAVRCPIQPWSMHRPEGIGFKLPRRTWRCTSALAAVKEDAMPHKFCCPRRSQHLPRWNSLSETGYLPSVCLFTECIPSGTRQRPLFC